MGFGGVFIARTCFPDAYINQAVQLMEVGGDRLKLFVLYKVITICTICSKLHVLIQGVQYCPWSGKKSRKNEIFQGQGIVREFCHQSKVRDKSVYFEMNCRRY